MPLDRESYQRARRIFHAASELESDARDRYLDAACADRPDLRREVDSLFAQERRSLVDALDRPPAAADLLRMIDAASESGAQPRAIGRYRLLERIGEGGFGVVYLAEQTEPVARRVALKILKSGMDSAQVIARFEVERQALAVMDHPCIARVIDAGTTDDARPYFVMELVQGDPITLHCDRERLSVAQRLELFRDVCGAVQHAHHKGIVHRDLKPTNVLVTVGDGRPLPKVIDFGIAKATSGPLTDRTALTAMHQMIGTPQYMSPEQAGGTSADIDTRSDIYALGVLLYELLTGSTPLEDHEVRSAALPELQRRICEDEPLRPSLRLSPSRGAQQHSSERTAADIARCRATDSTRLARQLRGDLDWIVMKCLEKDRSRRFATASALADDLGRYLDHQPVLASPPSTSYRLRKFVRRNRIAVVATAAVALALTAGAAVSVVFGLREARQRKQADIAKGRAETAEASAKARADELDQVARFQQAQLAGIDVQALGARLRDGLLAQVREDASRAREPGGADARAAQLEALLAESNFTGLALDALDEHYFQPARAAIEEQFDAQPLVQAQMLQTLASTMQALGLLAAAEEPQDAAVEIRRRELGGEHIDTITSIHGLGLLLQELGRFAEAEGCFREALAVYRRVLGDEHASTLNALGSLGFLRKAQGDLAGAETYYREALEKQRRVLGDEHPDTLASLNNLGALLLAQSKPQEAEPYLRSVLETNRRTLGDDDARTLKAIHNFAGLLQAQGRLAEAEGYYRESLEGCLRVLGDRHPDTLMAINNLGLTLEMLGRLAEAEPYCREALEKRRQVLGDTHPKTLTSLNNLGGLLEELGRPDEAEACYREALQARRTVLGDDHPDTIGSLNNLGWLLEAQGRAEEAESYYREAVERSLRVLGEESRESLIAIGNLASLLHDRGRPAEAAALLTPALPAMRRVFTGGNSAHLGRLLVLLGRCRVATGEFAAAEAHLLEAHAITREAENATDRQRAEAVRRLIELYDAWNAHEPQAGHGAEADAWRAKIPPAQSHQRQ